MLEVKNEIQDKVKHEFDQQQREYFLHQQMKTIQEELGGNSSETEIEELRQRAKTKTWDDSTAERFDKEIKKLNKHLNSKTCKNLLDIEKYLMIAQN